MYPRLHRAARISAVTLVLALAGLTAAPGASAHAQLQTTQPSNDAVVEQSPARVSLRFNEPVETAFGAIRVYDSAAGRVDRGGVERPSSSEVAVGLDSPLRRGTYTVTWRVLSADAHPISGAFVFHVGAPGAEPAGIAAQVLDDENDAVVTIVFSVVRFLDFALLLLAAGGAVALALVFRDAAPAVRRTLAGVLAAVAAVLALTALVGIVLQGAAAGGFGLAEALDRDVVTAVLETRFGRVWMLQAAAAAALAVLAVVLRRRQAGVLIAGAVALGAALVLTPALGGHASVGGPVAFLADAAHVQAAAAWTGGLAFVLLGLMWAGSERWPLAARVVPRFSTIAVLSVGALVVAGIVSSYLQVGAWRGLWDTTYGVLLLGKIGLVVPILALGAFNNRHAVPRLRAQIASPTERRRFLLMVGAELTLMAAVVGVTAVLVSEAPAKTIVAPKGPFSTFTQLGSFELNLVVDPAVAGRNDIHLYLTDRSGRPTAAFRSAGVLATLPSRSVGPFRLRAVNAGPGHLIVRGANLALAGDWQLTVEARVNEFEEPRRTVAVPIRKEH